MVKTLESVLKNEIDPAFAERAGLIFEAVEEKKPRIILDAGCGRGFYLNSISHFKFPEKIIGIDIGKSYIEAAKRSNRDSRVKPMLGSLYKIPFPDGYFDMVICSEVLEHLADDGKVLRELRRVLKPNGSLIITVPNRNYPIFWDPLNWFLTKVFKTHIRKDIWWLAGIWADHERLYSESQIENLIKNTGLKIEKKNLVLRHCWPFSHFLLYGIGKNIIEKLGVQSLSRFNPEKNSRLTRWLSFIFRLPAVFFDKKTPIKRSMNIFLCLTKI